MEETCFFNEYLVRSAVFCHPWELLSQLILPISVVNVVSQAKTFNL